jgi:hypothetical protein
MMGSAVRAAEPRTLAEREWDLVHAAIARMRARIMATVFGLAGGTGLFLATVWLLLKGGVMVGKNLNLLSNYFPGYSVSWGGAFLGFFYGALTGAALGFALAWVYNRIADRRHPAG